MANYFFLYYRGLSWVRRLLRLDNSTKKRFTLTIWIFAGFFTGIIAGTAVGEPALPCTRPLADIFLRLLRMAMMSVILGAVGLPLEGVGIILAVDRILDMFRTTLNVFTDSCGAVIISRFENSV